GPQPKRPSTGSRSAGMVMSGMSVVTLPRFADGPAPGESEIPAPVSLCQAREMTTVAPHGAWPSPITPEVVVQASVGLSEVWVEDPGARGDGSGTASAVWWAELRPEEGGRVQLVR